MTDEIMRDLVSKHDATITSLVSSVGFLIGNKKVPFEKGKVIDISNQGFGGHEVVNNGSEDRIHLIIDCFNNSKMKRGFLDG